MMLLNLLDKCESRNPHSEVNWGVFGNEGDIIMVNSCKDCRDDAAGVEICGKCKKPLCENCGYECTCGTFYCSSCESSVQEKEDGYEACPKCE